jgi:hypothetical protein
MSGPPGIVMYTFSPPTDAWGGSLIASGPDILVHDGDGNLLGTYHTGGEITDAYDWHPWAYWTGSSGEYIGDDVDSGPLPYVCNMQSHANVGQIKRLRCRFSVSRLPRGEFHIGQTAYSNLDYVTYPIGYIAIPGIEYWGLRNLAIESDGRVRSGLEAYSTNTINAGTEYELEWYIRDGWGPTTMLQQVWIDNTLWIDVPGEHYAKELYSPYPYHQLALGYIGGETGGGHDTVIHMENIVWTIEGLGSVGWTMMAPGIA